MGALAPTAPGKAAPMIVPFISLSPHRTNT